MNWNWKPGNLISKLKNTSRIFSMAAAAAAAAAVVAVKHKSVKPPQNVAKTAQRMPPIAECVMHGVLGRQVIG